MKKHIPNIITLGNLFCGCLAIVKIFEGDLIRAAYLVGIALICDFFDGFAARLLKVTSPIGKDLDSLADMVTFGVVPGLVMFHLNSSLSYFAFIIPIFSAIRLAKFNNDTRQTSSFIGLPTPANAALICSLPLAAGENYAQLDSWAYIPIVLIGSLLLVAEIPLFALKFKNFAWADNKIKYIFLVLCLVLLVALKFAAIPLIIILYILLSIVNNIFLNKKV
ncbi:MAG: CDP-diacylglycerol--serine O-phosphatidyltransferase [Bacteroidetes bacterium]|nr:CDP-diacylglycerol--serine O-phosphatidyltransferase [Bacteroidota bacterium]